MQGEAPSTAMSAEDFAHVSELAYARAGLKVRKEKAVMVSGRLARRATALGLGDVAAYCRLLRGPEMEREIPFLINALTTNHTSFYREHHHFDHLRSHVLPGLAAGARSSQAWLRMWSAACSTGEEPYTLAAIIRRDLGGSALPGLRVLATDIDTDVLATAERAHYARASFDAVPPDLRSVLIDEHQTGEHATIAKPVRDLVSFRQLNLIGPWPMRPGYEVILCRNVFIYFDNPTKAQLVDRFAELLKPGGYLYLGHTEFLTAPHPALEAVGRSIYRKLPA